VGRLAKVNRALQSSARSGLLRSAGDGLAAARDVSSPCRSPRKQKPSARARTALFWAGVVSFAIAYPRDARRARAGAVAFSWPMD
jgi:hypothetical protein